MAREQRGGRSRDGGRQRDGPSREVQVSKKMSWLLRHGAEKEGLKLDSAGYLNVADLLSNQTFRSLRVTFDEVRAIVDNNDKQRFTLAPVDVATASGTSVLASTTAAPQSDNSLSPSAALTAQTPLTSDTPQEWRIRANQGHSLKVVSEGLLERLTAETMPSTVVHGTTHGAWTSIVQSGGLKPMGRQHVHMASGLPSGFQSLDEDGTSAATIEAPVISGMRSSSTVLVYIDALRAMADGVEFWRSANGVVLTSGNEQGLLPLQFFRRAEDRTGEGVLVQDGTLVKEAPPSWVPRPKGRR